MQIRQVIILACTICLMNCSLFVSKPDHIETGTRVVTILHKQSSFKNSVIDKVRADIAAKGYTVIIDDVKRAKYYPARNFGAVVYMADYWAWHTPRHAKRYFRKNDKAENIIFVVTSGDPDIKITKPFDAVCSASEKNRIEPVAQEIITRLNTILH